MPKKFVAEFIGTAILVLFGCGTAVASGGISGNLGNGFLQILTIALAFGLSIVAVAYAFGEISGAHVNPAVSLATLINKRITLNEFVCYIIAQFLGAFAGSGILSFIVSNSQKLSGTGNDGFGSLSAVGISMSGAIVVEIVLTFVFVMTILGVTKNEKTSPLAGLVIGLTLAFVHILGIPLTGTSVNPARALSAGVFAGGEALNQVWVFIVAPFIGAAIAGILHKGLYCDGACPLKRMLNKNKEEK